MFKVLKEDGKNILVEVQGKVCEEDYDKFMPQLDELVSKYGKVNCVVNLDGVESFTPGAMLREIKASYTYRDNVGRYAIVDPKPALKELIEIASSLNNGEIRTFEKGKTEDAWRWIQGS